MYEFAQRITTLRKARAMTQEQLAQELGITAQAVSKWETGQSYPDITLLPKLAEVCGVRVDELLGCALEKDEDEPPVCSLPWSDDSKTIHAVLFAGHTLIGAQEVTNCPEASRITFEYEGEALNIDSVFAVSVDGDVQGGVRAGSGVRCENVGGDVKAGGSVNCDTVEGSVTCGDVGGNVTAGGSLSCGDVGGSAVSRDGSGKGQKKRRSISFSFDGKKFDTRQFERTMNELGQRMGQLGREFGEQVEKTFNAAGPGEDADLVDLDEKKE